MRILVHLGLIALVVVLPPSMIASSSSAQDQPPEVGDVVVEDALTQSGLMQPGTCATGRNSSAFVEDGLLLTVTGSCSVEGTSPGITSHNRGLRITDGEIRVDVRFTTGVHRASFGISFRTDLDRMREYYASIDPARGRAAILRYANDRQDALLGERMDLAGLISADGWNTVAVRVQGPGLWLIVNEQPVIFINDATIDSGGLSFSLFRTGRLDDEATSVVVRNFRLSRLAGGDQARAPTYTPRPESASAPQPQAGFVPPVGTPPEVGEVVVENAFPNPDMLRNLFCATGRASVDPADEGFVVRVRGRCQESAAVASYSLGLTWLTLPDGELRLDFKAPPDRPRTGIHIFARADISAAYGFSVLPTRGAAFIFRVGAGPQTRLAQRTDLAQVLVRDDWNTLAARLDGQSLWLFVNGQPVLSATDGALDTGVVSLGVYRDGDPNDDEEASAILRNVRVSKIANGDPARVPRVAQP